jgi:hypothetical protein
MQRYPDVMLLARPRIGCQRSIVRERKFHAEDSIDAGSLAGPSPV